MKSSDDILIIVLSMEEKIVRKDYRMQPKISIYQSEKQVVRDAIDKVIVQVYQRKREKGHVSFLVTGCSAGCGTTHTAINMAVALANAGWQTQTRCSSQGHR